MRVELQLPSGRKIRINARHDFKGHSQWNPAHGVAKAAQMGWRDHILTCGYKHVSGYNVVKDPATGRLSHCIQVASYKKHDDYAQTAGFSDANISPCDTTIINPDAREENDLVHVFWNLERAAGFVAGELGPSGGYSLPG